MTKADIINEIEKLVTIKLGWTKNYDNGTILADYTIYYNKRARKPIGWLQIGYYENNDSVICATIRINKVAYEVVEITNLNDIKRIMKLYYNIPLAQ